MTVDTTVPKSSMTPLEISYGGPVGRQRDVAPIGVDEYADESPRGAFRAEIMRALLRPPCVISFSGGRDSSTILAVAVDVARQEGLPLPIPATKFFPGVPESNETEWQESLLTHLGLTERATYQMTTECEVFGNEGLEVLRAHGIRFPSNLHFHLPIVRDTRGGTLMTGFGGDELGLAAMSRWHARAIAGGTASLPRRISERVRQTHPGAHYLGRMARKSNDPLNMAPWLTRRAQLRVRHQLALEEAADPLSWQSTMTRTMWQSRYTQQARESLDALAAPYQVKVVNPLVEKRTLCALGKAKPFAGYSSRREVLEELSAGLLPTAITRRTSKANFTSAPWGARAEEFIAQWDGSGVPHRFVDSETLRREWSLPLSERPGNSIHLLQMAWLSAAEEMNHINS